MKSSETEGCEASFLGIGKRVVDRYEVILGTPIEKAVQLWNSEGKPHIHLSPGENCEDLEKLLSNPDVSERHLEAVRAWLQQHKGGNSQ